MFCFKKCPYKKTQQKYMVLKAEIGIIFEILYDLKKDMVSHDLVPNVCYPIAKNNKSNAFRVEIQTVFQTIAILKEKKGCVYCLKGLCKKVTQCFCLIVTF